VLGGQVGVKAKPVPMKMTRSEGRWKEGLRDLCVPN